MGKFKIMMRKIPKKGQSMWKCSQGSSKIGELHHQLCWLKNNIVQAKENKRIRCSLKDHKTRSKIQLSNSVRKVRLQLPHKLLTFYPKQGLICKELVKLKKCWHLKMNLWPLHYLNKTRTTTKKNIIFPNIKKCQFVLWYPATITQQTGGTYITWTQSFSKTMITTA